MSASRQRRSFETGVVRTLRHTGAWTSGHPTRRVAAAPRACRAQVLLNELTPATSEVRGCCASAARRNRATRPARLASHHRRRLLIRAQRCARCLSCTLSELRRLQSHRLSVVARRLSQDFGSYHSRLWTRYSISILAALMMTSLLCVAESIYVSIGAICCVMSYASCDTFSWTFALCCRMSVVLQIAVSSFKKYELL